MNIGLLGHGVVGSGVQRIIDAGLTWEVRELAVKSILVKDEWEMTDPRCTRNVDDIIDDPEIDVVCECMGGVEPARTFLLRALKKGKHVVTSNKKMLANCAEELFAAARENNVAVHYEAACGGGIPWMASLDRTRRVDDIDSFRGIFNGTTNYILEGMSSQGREFDAMLKEAQQLGYAEQDPSEDIDGLDTRFKVALSVIKAFDALIDLDDIITYGIRNIRKADIDYAEANGMVCKLVGRAAMKDGSVAAAVMPMMLKKEDIFADIPKNFNAIESQSKTLGAATFVGQGAGCLPTAHAVVQNVVDIWKNQDPEINPKDHVHIDNTKHTGRFYIHSVKSAFMNDIIDRYVGENTFLTKEISLLEMNMMVQTAADPALFIAEVAE